MPEQIYNVFLYFDDNDVCKFVGYRTHEYPGDDVMAKTLLLANLDSDLSLASEFQLRSPFTRAEYNANIRLQRALHLIEQLFEQTGAGPAPFVVMTPVVKQKLQFNYATEFGPLDINDIASKFGARGHMIDWLVNYRTHEGFDLPKLINDDYLLAIKLTFNARLYVSAMKLLVSCIDSIGYIEFGDEAKGNSFIEWLNAYADLTPLEITAAELWELRNGLLHMTNLDSKKVRINKVRRISFRVGGDVSFSNSEAGVYYFDFVNLYHAFSQAISRWISTYNANPKKFPKFVERYDLIISDSRLAIAHLVAS